MDYNKIYNKYRTTMSDCMCVDKFVHPNEDCKHIEIVKLMRLEKLHSTMSPDASELPMPRFLKKTSSDLSRLEKLHSTMSPDASELPMPRFLKKK